MEGKARAVVRRWLGVQKQSEKGEINSAGDNHLQTPHQ